MRKTLFCVPNHVYCTTYETGTGAGAISMTAIIRQRLSGVTRERLVTCSHRSMDSSVISINSTAHKYAPLTNPTMTTRKIVWAFWAASSPALLTNSKSPVPVNGGTTSPIQRSLSTKPLRRT